MTKKLFIGLVVIVTGLFYGCVKDLHNSGITEATLLKGRVLEESEREPLVNVRVTVTNGTTEYTSTKTNNEGWFELTVNYNNFDGGNYLFLDAGSSGITKKVDLKGMGQGSYNYGDIFLYNKNDGATPTITTSAVKDITSNGAVCGGNITSDGGSQVIRRGLCWSVSENPTISSSNISCESGTGEFTGAITGLTPNTKYHVRAFATNAIGTAYGEDREFTTSNGGGHGTKPTVSTKSISSISSNSAICGGDVTSDGGSTVTERGLCWAKASTTHTPTISNYWVKDNGVGTGSFSCTMSDLIANTDYYVRAYAKNAVGISYGDPVSFTTLGGGSGHSAPTVETGVVSNIASYTATCSGIVTSDGGNGVQHRGICWSTSPQPRIPYEPWGGKTSESRDTWYVYEGGTGTGSFSCNLTNLSPNTKYYVCAFAQNFVGTSYGDDVSFSTLDSNTYPPEVVTWTIDYNSNNNTAICKGIINAEGGAPVNACGICWGTSQNVTIDNNSNVVYGNVPSSLPSMFTCTISGFSLGTTYYVRAFATNGHGTGYGNSKQLVIPGGGGTTPSAPTVSTNEPLNITNNSAICGGNVTSDGGANVIQRGVCYSTSPNPTTSSQVVTSGTGTGSFTCNLTGLSANTTYYVRAYAINSAGTGYGTQKSFTTGSGGSAPSAPTGVSATVSGSRIMVSWNSVSNADEYIVYWSNNGSSYIDIGTTSDLYFYDDAPSEDNYYKVKARNNYGESAFSSPVYCHYSSGGNVDGWLQYDDGNGIDALGFTNGGTIYWANMFPASMLGQYVGTSIVEIEALLNSTGTYTLQIYSGGTSSPGTLVAEINFTHNYSEFGWYTMSLPNTVTLDTSHNLWIVISKTHSSGEYPAGVCADSGDSNGRWLSDGSGTWVDMGQAHAYTWGIHTYVSNHAKTGKREKVQIISAQIKGTRIPNP